MKSEQDASSDFRARGPIMASLVLTFGLSPLGTCFAGPLGASMMDDPSASRQAVMPGQCGQAQVKRMERIRALKGKYAFIPVSSDQYARMKRMEMLREG